MTYRLKAGAGTLILAHPFTNISGTVKAFGHVAYEVEDTVIGHLRHGEPVVVLEPFDGDVMDYVHVLTRCGVGYTYWLNLVPQR